MPSPPTNSPVPPPALRPSKRRQPQSGPPPKRQRAPPLSGARTPHGSYRQYYARRHSGHSSSTDDDRIPLILPLLARYDTPAVLDIGCNDGALTTCLAPHAALVVGLDIDRSLVSRARKALRARTAALRIADRAKDDDFIPISCHVVQGPPPEPAGPTPHPTRQPSGDAPTKPPAFPFNLAFRCEDFAAPQPGLTAGEPAAYDVVLCLSVTKWVHMHGGDAALKRLFARMRNCLRPGGVLVLEPQPARSYKRARQKKIGGASLNFRDDLKLKPAQFKDFLLSDEGGFVKFEMLRDICEEKGKKSFNRPVMAFYKASSEQLGGEDTVEADKVVGVRDYREENSQTRELAAQKTALLDAETNGKTALASTEDSPKESAAAERDPSLHGG